MKTNWAVFISGTGSNLNSALEMLEYLNVSLVVSNRENAHGVKKARRLGIPVLFFVKPWDWVELVKQLEAYKITNVFLLGFMKVIPADFLRTYKGEILNLHPSLLPSFPGLESIKRAFESGADIGCTVHEVVEEVDAGPILKQKKTRRAENLSVQEFFVHLSEQLLVKEVLDAKI